VSRKAKQTRTFQRQSFREREIEVGGTLGGNWEEKKKKSSPKHKQAGLNIRRGYTGGDGGNKKMREERYMLAREEQNGQRSEKSSSGAEAHLAQSAKTGRKD